MDNLDNLLNFIEYIFSSNSESFKLFLLLLIFSLILYPSTLGTSVYLSFPFFKEEFDEFLQIVPFFVEEILIFSWSSLATNMSAYYYYY